MCPRFDSWWHHKEEERYYDAVACDASLLFLRFVAELVGFSFGLRTELNLLLDRSGRVKGVATLIIRIFAWSIRVICPIIVSV